MSVDASITNTNHVHGQPNQSWHLQLYIKWGNADKI